MARRKVPQREIADSLGMSQAAVSKRLAGVVPWDVNELDVVARVLEVPVTTLLGETAGAA
jgi:predicted transcriptional regulator